MTRGTAPLTMVGVCPQTRGACPLLGSSFEMFYCFQSMSFAFRLLNLFLMVFYTIVIVHFILV